MANTANFTSLEAFQAYVQEHGTDMWSRIFYGFKTAGLAASVSGVKGKYTLPNLTIGSNLSKRWTSTFEGQNNKATFGQRTLETFLNKMEFQFVPTEWEENYMGFLRKKNIQDPYDFPFEAYVIMKLIEKQNQEWEDAVWQAVQAGSPADGDLLAATFDGFLQIIADLITATTITPVVTGSVTNTNAVAKFRLIWEQVDKAYKEAGTAIFCSHTDYDNFRIDYKEKYHSSPVTRPIADTNYEGLEYELGAGRTMVIPIPGLGSSRRIICTPLDNLVIGYDGVDNLDLNVEKNHWSLDMFAAYRIGVQFRTVESGILVVSDQA